MIHATYDRESRQLTEERKHLLKRLSSLETKEQELLESRRLSENEVLATERADFGDLSGRLGKLTCDYGWMQFQLNFWSFYPVDDLVFCRLLLLGQHPAKGRVGGAHQDWLDGKPRLRVASSKPLPVHLVDRCVNKTSKDIMDQRRNVMASQLRSISFDRCLLLIHNISCQLIREIVLVHVLQATWQREKFAWVRLLGPWRLSGVPAPPTPPPVELPRLDKETFHQTGHRRRLHLVIFEKEVMQRILDPRINHFGVFMSNGDIWPNLIEKVRNLVLLFVQRFLTGSQSPTSVAQIGQINTHRILKSSLKDGHLRNFQKQVGGPVTVRRSSSFPVFQNAMHGLVKTEARIVTMLQVTQWLSELRLRDENEFHTAVLLSCIPLTPANTEQLDKLGDLGHKRMIDKSLARSCGKEVLSFLHGGHALFMQLSLPAVIREHILSFVLDTEKRMSPFPQTHNRAALTIHRISRVWDRSPPQAEVQIRKKRRLL